MKTRRRSRRTLLASAAILALQSPLANAVTQSGCSSLNTGSLGGATSSSLYMSAGKCSDTCNSSGHAFAIVQDQNCWCSNYAPGVSTSTGDCSSPCPGWPYEQCGNAGSGLFGYIALSKAPLGTQGGSSSNAPPSSTQQAASSYSAPPEPTTVEKTSVLSVVSTAIYTPPPTTETPSTSPVTVVKTTSISDDSDSSESISATTHTKYRPVTSTALVTVNGGVVTSVVTSTPTSDPIPEGRLPQPSHNGLSNGAVAGATVGALLGAALLGAIAFLCWRRRRTTNTDAEGNLSRNPSVLSRTGLLGSTRGDREEAIAGASTLPTLPRLQTTNQPMGFDPGSAATGVSSEMSENKRSSRPMFVDSRLNPHTIMNHPNASRTSIGTLQDNQDYSRPLEVRNPD